MKTTLTLLISIFLLASSCNKEDEPTSPYYKIEGTDYDYIPTVYNDIGKVISFKNQYDDEVKFEVLGYEIEKEFSSCFLVSNCEGEDWYYDRLDIGIITQNCESCQGITISITKTPIDDLIHRIMLPGEHSGNIKIFRTPSLTEYDISSMTINEITYNNVLTFEVSGEFVDFYTLYDESTIHKVYYDLNQGFIGFDDTENNLQFRIVN